MTKFQRFCLIFLGLTFVREEAHSKQLLTSQVKFISEESRPISGESVDVPLIEFTMTSDIQKKLQHYITSQNQLSKIPRIGKFCEARQRVTPWAQSRKLKKYRLLNGKWKLAEVSQQNRAGESRILTPGWTWPLIPPDSRDTDGKITWTTEWLSGTPIHVN